MCIKELREGSCIGEFAIEGSQVAPYSIKSSSVVHVGQITVTDLAGKTARSHGYIYTVFNPCSTGCS